jgi:tRNA(His) 5'-end guanylyltransferase
MQDDLGDRMKGNYEDRTRIMLPRRTYTIIRLDGKAFHTYTKGLQKPFDKGLSEDMDNAIIAIMSEIQGAVFAYTQSDEISILVTDFALPTTSAWFDGNLQKMVSVSASLITGEFNRLRARRWSQGLRAEMALAKMGQDDFSEFSEYTTPEGCIFKVANFDSRVFTIPDRTEVMNYFIWRNQDCARNSVSMVAYANFSHKELQGKNTPAKHDMLKAKGINWATDFSDGEKNGRLIVKEEYFCSPRGNEVPEQYVNGVTRTRWVAKGAWKFTEDKDKLLAMIPTMS